MAMLRNTSSLNTNIIPNSILVVTKKKKKQLKKKIILLSILY